MYNLICHFHISCCCHRCMTGNCTSIYSILYIHSPNSIISCFYLPSSLTVIILQFPHSELWVSLVKPDFSNIRSQLSSINTHTLISCSLPRNGYLSTLVDEMIPKPPGRVIWEIILQLSCGWELHFPEPPSSPVRWETSPSRTRPGDIKTNPRCPFARWDEKQTFISSDEKWWIAHFPGSLLSDMTHRRPDHLPSEMRTRPFCPLQDEQNSIRY